MTFLEHMRNEIVEAMISPLDKWALCINVITDYGGGVDFDNSKYEIKTLVEFSEDDDLIEKLKDRLSYDTDIYSPRMLGALNDPVKLGKLFQAMSSNESFSVGVDAMTEKEYKHEMKLWKQENHDY